MKWKENLINNVLWDSSFSPNYYNPPNFLQALFLTVFEMLATSNLCAPFKKGKRSLTCVLSALSKYWSAHSPTLTLGFIRDRWQ